jgi:EAL and modified HD-GYP domain-containing signal transduction protein
MRLWELRADGKETESRANMVRAIENDSLFDFREAADALMLGVSEVNRAQLRALTAASQLE